MTHIPLINEDFAFCHYIYIIRTYLLFSGVCVLGERLFAVGGYDGSGYQSVVESYEARLVEILVPLKTP